MTDGKGFFLATLIGCSLVLGALTGLAIVAGVSPKYATITVEGLTYRVECSLDNRVAEVVHHGRTVKTIILPPNFQELYILPHIVDQCGDSIDYSERN